MCAMAVDAARDSSRYLGAETDDFSNLSIIVPTRNEANNVDELLARVRNATKHLVTEVVFVDDSDDDTPGRVRRAAHGDQPPHRTVVLHRPPGRRSGGLGGAVLEGIQAASWQYVVVIDADLQHPPEVIPALLGVARTSGADVVIASRYTGDGTARGLRGVRVAVSRVSTLAAKVAFPGILLGVTDPMSGFFLVRKDALRLDHLEPSGFKVLLELLVANPRLRVNEVAYEFGDRASGDSKSSLREGMRYVRRVCELRLSLRRAAAHRPGVLVEVGRSAHG